MTANVLPSARTGKPRAAIDPELLRALAPLAKLLAPLVAEELHAQNDAAGPADEWIDQRTSPLGRRMHNLLCRTGKLAGARKVGHAWKVPREAVDAYIRTHGKAPAPSVSAEQPVNEHDATDKALRDAGLVSLPGGRR